MMIATGFELADYAYYIQVVSGVALLVLGFIVRKRSPLAMQASIWIVAINFLIGLHKSSQNFGLGTITILGALWAFGILWILSGGVGALHILKTETPTSQLDEETPALQPDMVREETR
jgi:hypothetical protein